MSDDLLKLMLLLTGVIYTKPTRNPAMAVPKDTCHILRFGNVSIITVNAHACNATRQPTPNTKSMKKNSIANNWKERNCTILNEYETRIVNESILSKTYFG